MPSVTVLEEDLLALVGEGLDMKGLNAAIENVGGEIKGTNQGDVELEFLANRPDLFCVEGIARQVRSFLGIGTHPEYKITKIFGSISVDSSVESIRPYIASAMVRGVRMDDHLIRSIMDIQEKLHSTFGRRRKKVAIGVHDPRDLVFPLKYSAVKPDSIKFVPLMKEQEMNLAQILSQHEKGRDYAHILDGLDLYPVIIDSKNNVVSFPPIINGAMTQVREDTKDLFLELTGTDREAVSQALNILVSSFADRGGTIEGMEIRDSSGNAVRYPDFTLQQIELECDYMRKLLGMEISGEEAIASLARMGFASKIRGGTITATVPIYRADILHPVDLIEDIAIGYGYEKLKAVVPGTYTVGDELPGERHGRNIRHVLIGMGYQEVITSTLTSETELFEKMLIKSDTAAVTKIKNRMAGDYTCLRTSLVPSLLMVLSENAHHDMPQRIFEVGDVVINGRNHRRFSLLGAHAKSGFTEVKGVVQAICREMSYKFDIKESSHPYYISGRGAEIIINGKSAGDFGEINPQVLENFGISTPVVSVELSLE